MTPSMDNRLFIEPYHEALESVETQFALIRFALNGLPKSRIQEFFKSRLKNTLAIIDAGMEDFGKDLPPEQKEKAQRGAAYWRREWIKQEKRKNRPADARFKLELSEDRLNQSELLLLVAHFESFMKQVHRTFLRAGLAKLISDSDTKISPQEVFNQNTGDPVNRFFKELVAREVNRLDKEGIEKRIKYFSDYFVTSPGRKNEIDELKEIMDQRNEVTHAIFSPPPRTLEQVKEQPLVSDQMLARARSLFREVPRRWVQVGAKRFPAYFR
jgi:RiboL-PSP-HEPN